MYINLHEGSRLSMISKYRNKPDCRTDTSWALCHRRVGGFVNRSVARATANSAPGTKSQRDLTFSMVSTLPTAPGKRA